MVVIEAAIETCGHCADFLSRRDVCTGWVGADSGNTIAYAFIDDCAVTSRDSLTLLYHVCHSLPFNNRVSGVQAFSGCYTMSIIKHADWIISHRCHTLRVEFSHIDGNYCGLFVIIDFFLTILTGWLVLLIKRIDVRPHEERIDETALP